jgi:hypothetical protein
LGGNEQVFVGPEGIVGIKCHSGDVVFHGDILAQTISFANVDSLRPELRGESSCIRFTAVARHFFHKKKNKSPQSTKNSLQLIRHVHICDVLT